MGEIDARALALEEFRRYAAGHMLGFMQWCWWMPPDRRPLKVGRHTRALCERFDRAIEDFKAGKSTYLVVNMPFRHGKSDLVSRALPAYFLGRCAEFQPDVIMSGYGTSLVKGFSAKVQGIMRSEAYQRLYPGVKVDPVHCAKEEWCVEGSQGLVTAQGLGGAITGKGGNLIIVDDYCKNREEAESDVMRNKMWESFKDDLMTRTNSPAAIVVVCATRWHEDDIVGRIFAEMKKDPDYPRFESLIFPAHKAGPDGWDTLFPELYSADWYRRQRASLGSYSSAALLDCAPVSDAMKEFKSEWLCFYDDPPPRSRLNVYVFVDASSGKRKETGKETSDRTAMQVWGYGEDENYYLLDFVYDRINLTERTEALFDLVRFWKPNVTFYEEVGLMADIPHMQDVMNREGVHFPIVPLKQSVKKETRIRGAQPLFEARRVWFPKYLRKVRADGQVHFPVQDMIEEEYKTFPGCRHDDGIDCLANLMHPQVVSGTHFPMGETAVGREDAAARANTKWKPFR